MDARPLAILVSLLLTCTLMELGEASFVFQTLEIRTSGQPCPEAHCRHGGQCNAATRTCACTVGYAGKLCEYPVCNLACQNNGTCVGPNHCHCSPSYKGKQCEDCTSYGRRQCRRDASCAVYEDTPGVCCPPCRHRFWRGNCVPGACRPATGCRRYAYNGTDSCCPRCVEFAPECLASAPCAPEEGCLEHALTVPRGKCCPRCERFRCSGVECPAVSDCVLYEPAQPGRCCPRCLARRSSCPGPGGGGDGAACAAVDNCAAYAQQASQCCATCKRLKKRSKRLKAGNPCATIQCPDTMDCHAKGRRAVCRCKRRCPKKKRTVCGSDGNLHRNRCRLLRTACLKAIVIRPVQMPFCTYYGPRIQKTLISLHKMTTQSNSYTNLITLLGERL